MLSFKDLTVSTDDGATTIVHPSSGVFQSGGMNAIVGPSGCGKTTLVKAMQQIIGSQGDVMLDATRVKSSADLLGRVGFAPQFSIAQPPLTVEESLRYALELTVADPEARRERLQTIPEIVGLDEHRAKRVSQLSGGQLRRLGLGLELTSDPEYLVCDEVTSGLDPNSEDAVLRLMRDLCVRRGKTFICIIHNLAKLEDFDWINVIYGGSIVFQGTEGELREYFQIPNALHLYDRLEEHSREDWLERWAAWSEERFGTQLPNPNTAKAANEAGSEAHPANDKSKSPHPEPAARPGVFAQFLTLAHRRLLLFARDTGYLGLTLAITFGFPLLVVIFALDGLPQLSGLPAGGSLSTLEYLRAELTFELELAKTGTLVTGLILFQVILLTLMGSNNGAREIAAERVIYEKERFSGLSPGAYALSKVLFVLLLSVAQGLWMTGFVKAVCEFPGDTLLQAATLTLSCFAMSTISLGLSALLASAEKASLLSIYLVGFQLPLAGVVLALPDFLVWVCRPWINAFWGWSGYLTAMKGDESLYYDAAYHSYEKAYGSGNVFLASPSLALAVLGLHAVAGIALTWVGCRRKIAV